MSIYAGPRYIGRPRGFSSASVIGGLGAGRSSGAPVCQPTSRPSGPGGYSSISLNHFGGLNRRIAYGQGYGGQIYGGIGGQGIGTGGQCIGGPGINVSGQGIVGHCIPGQGIAFGGQGIGGQCFPGQVIGTGEQGIGYQYIPGQVTGTGEQGIGYQYIPGQVIGTGGQGIGGHCIPGQVIGIGSQGIGGQCIPVQGIGTGGHGLGIGAQYIPGQVIGTGGQGVRIGGQCIPGQGIGGLSYGSPEYQGGFGGISGRMGTMGGRGEGIRRVSIDESLLKPLSVGVDPEEQKARTHEKEEMKTLNNQFACFIDKVRSLEQQNKVLSTKWEVLNQCVQPARKNLEGYYENFVANLKRQLDCLLSEREKLEHEQKNMQELVEEYRSKYEDEVNKRTTAENDFVILKKDVDSVFLTKEELESKVDVLAQELEVLRSLFTEELSQMEGKIIDTSVVLKMDNTRDLDMDRILQNVENWYQNIAHASKQEAEAFYHNKIAEIQNNRNKYNEELKSNQHEIGELNRVIQRLNSDADNLKKQVASLHSAICDSEQRGDTALKDAKKKHSELQNAYQKTKEKLASLVHDYQDLLNTKMGLDIEIATYKMMLEGEENRISSGNPVSVAMVSGGYPVGECAPGMAYGAAYGGRSKGFTSGSAGCIQTMGPRVAGGSVGITSGTGYGVGHAASGVGTGGAFSSRSGGGHIVGAAGGRHSSGISLDGSCVSGHHGGIHHMAGAAGGIAIAAGSGGYSTSSSGIGIHSPGAGGAYATGTQEDVSAATSDRSQSEVRNVHVVSGGSSARKSIN